MTLVAQIPISSVAELHGALEAHVRRAVRDLRDHPRLPPIYRSGVRYEIERPGRERWLLPSEVAALGRGDCEDLATWAAAQHRITGSDPAARVVTYQSAPNIRHAVVRRGSGKIEDPSRRLGMGSARDRATRRRFARGLGDAMANGLKWKVRKLGPNDWEGEATVTLDPRLLPGGGPSQVTARARGRSRGSAASRTIATIDNITKSPLLRAVLPPGAGAAIDAAKKVASLFAGLMKKKRRRPATTTTSGLPSSYEIVHALRRRGASPAILGLAETCGDWSES